MERVRPIRGLLEVTEAWIKAVERDVKENQYI